MNKTQEFIRNTYIPELMKGVFKADKINFKDYTQDDWIKFHQAIYDKVKLKESQLMVVKTNKN